jgi:hypothetical protein
MERSCETQLRAEAAGGPKLIPETVARKTRQQIGLSPVGWLSFQPLWDRITREQPDLLD